MNLGMVNINFIFGLTPCMHGCDVIFVCVWMNCPKWPTLCQPQHTLLLKERQGYFVMMCINFTIYAK